MVNQMLQTAEKQLKTTWQLNKDKKRYICITTDIGSIPIGFISIVKLWQWHVLLKQPKDWMKVRREIPQAENNNGHQDEEQRDNPNDL